MLGQSRLVNKCWPIYVDQKCWPKMKRRQRSPNSTNAGLKNNTIITTTCLERNEGKINVAKIPAVHGISLSTIEKENSESPWRDPEQQYAEATNCRLAPTQTQTAPWQRWSGDIDQAFACRNDGQTIVWRNGSMKSLFLSSSCKCWYRITLLQVILTSDPF